MRDVLRPRHRPYGSWTASAGRVEAIPVIEPDERDGMTLEEMHQEGEVSVRLGKMHRRPAVWIEDPSEVAEADHCPVCGKSAHDIGIEHVRAFRSLYLGEHTAE